MSIFKAYDIRGLVGDQLNELMAYKIGFGLANRVFSANSPILISRDARSHSEKLSNALICGLNAGGCSVINIGLASTPMNYWANVHFEVAGSVQITASHNGPEYNGFKVSLKNAIPVGFDTGLKEVKDYIEKENIIIPEQFIPSKIKSEENSLEKYLEFMYKFIKFGNKKLKIIVDAGNGMAGHFMEKLAKELKNKIEILPLFWELDGNFPNHSPDPMKEANLSILKQKVKEFKADAGVAFDGDADRCVFIDENGQFISSDLIVTLIALQFLKEEPKQKILYDLRSSAILKEMIELEGGVAIPGKVGHSFMKKALKDNNAIFGGELSGHYYFRDCFNTDSGLMAMIKVLNILTNTDKTLSELIKPFRKYFSSNEISFKVQNAKEIVEKIKIKYEKDAKSFESLDGLTMRFDDWWFNIRESNTEPLLRLTLETFEDEGKCKQKVEELSAFMK